MVQDGLIAKSYLKQSSRETSEILWRMEIDSGGLSCYNELKKIYSNINKN